MAFINLSKLISDGNKGDDIVVHQSENKSQVTEAYVPFGEYIDEFVRLSAEAISEHYSRVPRILYEDLLKGTSSVMFKMAESFISSVGIDGDPRKKAMSLMVKVFGYINIDNCIRIHFSDEREVNKLIMLSAEKLNPKDIFMSGGLTSKDIFVKLIVPYIREYVNENITFTEKDKEAYDAMFSDNIGKGSHETCMCIEDFGVPLSSDVKEDRIMYTYSKPKRNGSDVSFLGKSLCRFSADKEFSFKYRLTDKNQYPDFNEYGYMYSLSESAMNAISPFINNIVINDFGRNVASELNSMPNSPSADDIRQAFERFNVSEGIGGVISSQYVTCSDEYIEGIYNKIKNPYTYMVLLPNNRLCPAFSVDGADGKEVSRSYAGFSSDTIPTIDKLLKVNGIGAMDLDVIISEHIAPYFKPMADGYILKEMMERSDDLRLSTYKFRDNTPLGLLDNIYGLDTSKVDGFSRLRGVASVCMVAHLQNLNSDIDIFGKNQYKPYLTNSDTIDVEFRINSGVVY